MRAGLDRHKVSSRPGGEVTAYGIKSRGMEFDHGSGGCVPGIPGGGSDQNYGVSHFRLASFSPPPPAVGALHCGPWSI